MWHNLMSPLPHVTLVIVVLCVGHEPQDKRGIDMWQDPISPSLGAIWRAISNQWWNPTSLRSRTMAPHSNTVEFLLPGEFWTYFKCCKRTMSPRQTRWCHASRSRVLRSSVHKKKNIGWFINMQDHTMTTRGTVT